MDAEDALKTLAAVRLARNHATRGQHGAATAILMQALQTVPQLAEELEEDLTFSLKTYGEHLASIGQPSSALWLYSQAIPLLPRPRGLHTNLGTLQYSLGKAAASMESFERALTLDPGYWPALESLENVKSLAVDRWHFRMLNHSARNEAYARAIQRAVAAAAADRSSGAPCHGGRRSSYGVTVLDIGTGTGILAVMAAKAGAKHVYACEVNGVLCDIAREVLESRNGVADRVTIIHKSSGALQPGVDVPEGGVDVIVTELVDSGLLGEKIIPVLTDARARGLLAHGGRVVPEGARVYAAVIESDAVRRRSRLLPGNPAGLSVESVRPTIEEPYTCEDLGRLEHHLLTPPTAVLDVDFLRDGADLVASSAVPSLPSDCSTADGAAPRPHVHPPLAAAARSPVTRSGRADAVAVWFDLWLDGERGEQDIVSTRPERETHGDASGWDAGIYFASGADLTEGRNVRLGASAGLDRLRFAVNGQEGFVPNQLATGTAPGDGAAGLSSHSMDTGSTMTGSSGASTNGGHVHLGEMDLARLNDGAFHSSHAAAVAEALSAQGVEAQMPTRPLKIPTASEGKATTGWNSLPAPTSKTPPAALATAGISTIAHDNHLPPPSPPPPAFVLDLCGAWGVAGLLVAQLERREQSGTPATRVLAVAESGEAAAVLNAIARENGLGPDRYVATADRLIDLAANGGEIAHDSAPGASGGDTSAVVHVGGRQSSAANGRAGGGSERGGSGDARGRPEFDWPTRGSGLAWAVVMASSLVEGSGLLKQGGLGELELCREFVSHGGRFRSGGGGGGHAPPTAFAPGRLEVVCQGLQRASLLSENRVRSDRCCGVDVDPVNAFSVATFRELDLSKASPCCGSGESTAAATAAAAGRNREQADRTGRDVNQRSSAGRRASCGGRQRKEGDEEKEAFLTEAAVCYDVDLADVRAGPGGCLERRPASLRVRRAGTLHAIAYWYRQNLGTAVMVDTLPSTSSHFRQAAVVLKEPVEVEAGQSIDVCVFCHTSKGVVVQVSGITGPATPGVAGDMRTS
ncbi:unnamed protein product [Scytosiphon promiscuus]